jgi:plasmid stabilization system protein ParE
MNVHWTEAGLADLRAVETYIARHSPQYARSTVERIFDRSATLADQPLLGSVVPEYEDETVRELIETPYRIYRVLEAQIDILAVVHGSRRLPRSL